MARLRAFDDVRFHFQLQFTRINIQIRLYLNINFKFENSNESFFLYFDFFECSKKIKRFHRQHMMADSANEAPDDNLALQKLSLLTMQFVQQYIFLFSLCNIYTASQIYSLPKSHFEKKNPNRKISNCFSKIKVGSSRCVGMGCICGYVPPRSRTRTSRPSDYRAQCGLPRRVPTPQRPWHPSGKF